MPSQNLKVTPEQIAQTIQSAATSKEQMAAQFKILDQRVDEVLPYCSGAAASALTQSLTQLSTDRNKLISQLGPLLDNMKKAGVAVSGQDADTATTVRGAVASVLNHGHQA